MKAKITYIDDSFFCHTNEASGVIILFKKTASISDNQNEDIANIIELNIKKSGTNVSCTELLSGINNSKVLNVLKNTLFIYVANQGNYISQELQPIFSHNKVELTINKTLIAKIIIGTKHTNKILFLLFIILISIVIVNYIRNNNKEKKITENLELYHADIFKIRKIKDEYDKATNSHNSYVEYLSPTLSTKIKDYILCLKQNADSNYNNIQNTGKYSSLVISEDSIKHEIFLLVENAKSIQKQRLEEDRKEANTIAFNNNLNTVNILVNHLKKLKSNNEKIETYLDKHALSEIADSLVRLKTLMINHKKMVEDKGYYTPIIVRQDFYKKSIDRIFEIAKDYYISAQQENKEKKETNKVKKHNTKSSSTKHNKRYNKYKQQTILNRGEKFHNSSSISYKKLVYQANQDYKAFYYSNKKDKGAAQRAIIKYQKAQDMNFDSSINVRIKKLQNDLR